MVEEDLHDRVLVAGEIRMVCSNCRTCCVPGKSLVKNEVRTVSFPGWWLETDSRRGDEEV